MPLGAIGSRLTNIMEPLAGFASARPNIGESTVIGVSVTFQYGEDFDRERVASIAEGARGTFEGMPGLRSKGFHDRLR